MVSCLGGDGGRTPPLRVTHIISIDIGGYTYNSLGFCEKFTYPLSRNKTRIIATQGAHANLVKTLSFLIFLS